MKFQKPQFLKVRVPGHKNKRKYRAVKFEKIGGLKGTPYYHFIEGPHAGIWYKETALGFGKTKVGSK